MTLNRPQQSVDRESGERSLFSITELYNLAVNVKAAWDALRGFRTFFLSGFFFDGENVTLLFLLCGIRPPLKRGLPGTRGHSNPLDRRGSVTFISVGVTLLFRWAKIGGDHAVKCPWIGDRPEIGTEIRKNAPTFWGRPTCL